MGRFPQGDDLLAENAAAKDEDGGHLAAAAHRRLGHVQIGPPLVELQLGGDKQPREQPAVVIRRHRLDASANGCRS